MHGSMDLPLLPPFARWLLWEYADVAAHAEGGITPSRQVLVRSKMVTNWGGRHRGAASHLPFNHTESTHKCTASIRAEPFTQTRVDEPTSVKSVCNLPALKFGNRIPSLRFNSSVTADLRSEQQLEKMLFSIRHPPTSVSLSECSPVMQLLCNVWRHILFYLMVPSGFPRVFHHDGYL